MFIFASFDFLEEKVCDLLQRWKMNSDVTVECREVNSAYVWCHLDSLRHFVHRFRGR
jgi:hypothetical protein